MAAIIFCCGDEYYDINGHTGPGLYSIETEPSLSPDRNYLYYISNDTTSSLYRGIYRASVETPVREKILHGLNYHSPTISLDNNTIAYLDSGKINYYRMSDMAKWTSAVADSFESILFVSDSVILANRNDSLFLVDEAEKASAFWIIGWDPTLVSRDTFVYFVGTDSAYHIVKNNLYNIHPETLFTVATTAWPRWPSFDPESNHLAFEIERFHQKFIYSAEVAADTFIFIDSSEYSKPYILNHNLIIFTGPDGRFYQSDFYGTKSVPFIYVKY